MRSLRSAGCLALLLAALPRLAEAQIIAAPAQVPGGTMGFSRSVPGPTYEAVFGVYFDGQLDEALKAFRSEGRGGLKTAESSWIDSICYHTMVGECLYQLGQPDAALEQYVAALRLYLAFRDWMVRVAFPPGIAPLNLNSAAPPPWGQSARRATLGRYPETMTTAIGEIDITRKLQQGGVVQAAMQFPINAVEIVRCTTLAIRRWTELMGPLASHDPLTKSLVSALSRRPGPPNHWSEAWIDTQLGLAYLAEGKLEQAKTTLERAQVAGGEFDHPLTSTVLLELGKLALGGGDLVAASRYFAEATYAAYVYLDPVVMEEAFRQGLNVHLISNQDGLYAPLVPAAAWARARDLRQLHVALLLMAAENALAQGETAQGLQFLGEAKPHVTRRAMLNARAGARLNFLTAQAYCEQGQADQGADALAAALQFQSHGSLRLFQQRLVDQAFESEKAYTGGVVAPRLAIDLYAQMLADPGPELWSFDPLEALSVMVGTSNESFENWFRAAVLRKDTSTALYVAELTRRHRFLSTLDLGGRLLALRWLMEAPAAWLDPAAQLQRQGLALRYPKYPELAERSRQSRADLLAQPLAPEDADGRHAQTDALGRWQQTLRAQEALLSSIALRREPATISFPPVRGVEQVQQALRPDQVVIGFFAAKKRLYGYGISRDNVDLWPAGGTADVLRKAAKLLREMGLLDANRAMTHEALAKTEWQATSQSLWDGLLGESKLSVPGNFRELILIPEGPLWYVPFEALRISAGEESTPLISQIRVRCAPSMALAVIDGGARAGEGRTGVVAGKLYPRDSADVAAAAFEDLRRIVPGASLLNLPLPGPAPLCASLCDRLVVLDDLEPATGGPYRWAPIPPNKGDAALGAWLDLPFEGPREVILPGFHTAAESALKKAPREQPGDEIYLSVMALLASGTRTALISRWRTGGQSAFQLARDFTQELAHAEASEAWQRAVFLLQDTELDPDAEPRLEASKKHDPPKGDHPFFWAGYLLVDLGHAAADDAPAEDPTDEDAAPNPGDRALQGSAGKGPVAFRPPAEGADAKSVDDDR